MGTGISDNDGFWRDFESILFPPTRSETARNEVNELVTLLDPAPGSSVLDLPCGVGRHSIELAMRGFRITGVDRYQPYLDRAVTQSRAAGVDVEWIHADMREFDRPASFDVALCLWTSFGYFETPAADAAVLSRFRRHLKPGGRLVMELKGKENLAAEFRPRDWSHEDDGVVMLHEREVLDHWTRIRNTWTALFPDGRRAEHTFVLNLYSAGELISMLTAAGFESCRAYGSFAGVPYDHRARRLVIVATARG